jgi:hypothetical protein
LLLCVEYEVMLGLQCKPVGRQEAKHAVVVVKIGDEGVDTVLRGAKPLPSEGELTCQDGGGS